MKLMVPVAGMVVAAGSCCCCGMDPQALLERFTQAGEEASWTPESAEGVVGENLEEGEGAPTGGGVTAGLCGRYKDEGLSLPNGFKVIGCTTTTGAESLLAMGATPPNEVCASVKAWAVGGGWNVESEVDLSGTVAMMLKNGGSRMSLSCTDSTGQTSVAVSITAG